MKYSDSEDLIVSAEYIQLFSSYSKKIKIISRKTKVTLLGKISSYSLSEKSNYSYGLKIKQPIGDYRYISFKYNYVDDIYLRAYVDVDQGVVDYIYTGSNCFFDNSKINIDYEFPILNKKSKINISYLYESQFYNQFFTEFDLIIDGFKMKYSNKNKEGIFGKYSLSLKYLNAKNVTLNDYTLSTSYMDRGYSENNVSLIYYYNINNQQIGFSRDSTKRKYSSAITEDQLHLSRKHKDIQLSIWYAFNVFYLKNKIIFKHRKRETSSSYRWVEKLKSFDKYNVDYIIYF